MKKLLCILLCLMLSFSLFACNGDDSSSSSSDSGSTTESTDTGTSSSSGDETPADDKRSAEYVSLWSTDTITNETVMLQEDETGWIAGGLLFEPTEILEIKNYDLTISYDSSDYVMNGRYMERKLRNAVYELRHSKLFGFKRH